MRAAGRADLADDPRLAHNAGRVEHEQLIDDALAKWTRSLDSTEVLSRLAEADVPSGPIYSVADIMEDPHYRAREMFHRVEIDREPLVLPAMSPRLGATPGGTEWPGPALGSHNREILEVRLGLGEAEIEGAAGEGRAVMRGANRVADSLAAVRERIGAAERRFGRRPGSVSLVAVAKTRPASLIREAWEAGQRQFGENFVQEAVAKLDELSRLSGPGGIEWHFVGALQANKSRTVAERFAWVHTVDRLRIARRLSDQRPAWLPPLNVCLQVNVSEESSKSGIQVAEAAGLASAVAELPRLRLRGLMAIPRPCTGIGEQRARAPAPGRSVRTPARRRPCPRYALHGHDRRPRGGGGGGEHHGPDRNGGVRTARRVARLTPPASTPLLSSGPEGGGWPARSPSGFGGFCRAPRIFDNPDRS